MKFILAVIATAFLSTSAMACAVGMDKDTIITSFAQNKEITVSPLTNDEIKKLTEKLGPPPHGDGSVEDLSGVLAEFHNNGVIAIFQGGCFIDKIGPGPKEVVEQAIGRVES